MRIVVESRSDGSRLEVAYSAAVPQPGQPRATPAAVLARLREAWAARPPSSATAPGPKGVPMVGMLIDFWSDPLRTLLDAARLHGDVVRLPVGPYDFYLLNHPDFIRHVLQEKNHNYPKSPSYALLEPVLGRGLLTSEGETWLRQRRLVQPGFHRQRLASFGDAMVRTTIEQLGTWEERIGEGQTFDVAREMMKLTLRIVGRTLFSTEIGDEDGDIGAAISTVQRYVNDREMSIVRLPMPVPTPANRKARAALGVLDALVFRIIAARRGQDHVGDDLLGMLLDARDERSNEGMSDRELRDEVMTLVLAGHETTASALAWTFMLLSQHPSVERQAADEVRTVLGARDATVEDLSRLRYVSMVLQESMRLYPPAWAIERQAREEDEIGGFTVPAGSLVLISAYTMHRNPMYWENPEGFDPERFVPERAEHRPRGAYIPFGAGPRMCIGHQFAMMEAQLVLATILQRYRLDLVSGHTIVPEPLITLRPRDGIHMRLVRRTHAV